MTKKEWIHIIAAVALVLLGLTVILGTAGASDCGTISLTRAAVQCGIGLLLVLSAFVIDGIGGGGDVDR